MTSRLFLSALALLPLAACASLPDLPELPDLRGGARDGTAPAVEPLTAAVLAGDGTTLGAARLEEGPGGVLLRLELRAGALSPGWHGLHLHAVGDCSDAAFKAAGDHVGHGEAAAHGLLNPKGPEAGDLPNVFAPATGPFGAEFFTNFVTLDTERPGRRMSLLDADGSALVIHAEPDDHRSQPIGGAGARVACAVLKR